MTKANVGGIDTAIRAALGTIFMAFAAVFADDVPFLALGLALVALVALSTAIAGTCPLYGILGIDTRSGAPTAPYGVPRHFAVR